MSGLIGVSSSGGSGSKYGKLIISDFKEVNKSIDAITISYIAINNDNKPLQHFIIVDGVKQEITTDVNAQEINREFTYTLKNLKAGTSYNLQIEVTDGVNAIQSVLLTLKTNEFLVYGVNVTTNNSNPETSVTYIENAIGVNPAKNGNLNGWEDKWPFNKIRIVGFKNGQVVKEIKKENKKQYIDGTTVPNDVDVMVEIPKIYWKSTIVSNGYEIRISNIKKDSEYKCLAHLVENIEKDNIYIGTYLGSIESARLRSISGTIPTTNKTLADFRQYAQNVGKGYQLDNWYPLILRKILYLIAYKNLDSQTALGKGYTSNSNSRATGGANARGLCYGSTNTSEQVCFLGIEDFYGNLYTWVDGMYYNGNIMVTADNKTFNDSASGFKNVGSTTNWGSGGYISDVVKTTEGLFFPYSKNGSTSTYYSDFASVYSGCFSIHGGYYGDGDYTGAFYLHVYCRASGSYSNVGGRLVYMG